MRQHTTSDVDSTPVCIVAIRFGDVLPNSDEKPKVSTSHNTTVFVPVRHPTPSHELFTLLFRGRSTACVVSSVLHTYYIGHFLILVFLSELWEFSNINILHTDNSLKN